MRRSLPLSIVLLSSLVLLLAVLPACRAHVEFAIAVDTAGDDGFLTWLKIPHGCVLSGPDDGDAPESDIEAPTSLVQITVPAEIPIAVPGVLTGWTLTRLLLPSLTTPSNNISVFTYTATAGNELVPWQSLAIPFIFTLPSPINDTVYYMPVVQNCTGGYTVNWTTNYDPTSTAPLPPHPTPTILVLGTSDPPATSTTTIVQNSYGSSSSDSDEAMSITAIVLVGLLVVGLLTVLAMRWLMSQSGSTTAGGNDRNVQLTNSYAAAPGTPDISKSGRMTAVP